MKLRFYAAVVTGALAEFLTLAGLWAWSNMELIGMAFCSVWAYIFSLLAVMYITEPRKRKREPERQRRGKFKVYNLKAEAQYELREETA